MEQIIYCKVTELTVAVILDDQSVKNLAVISQFIVDSPVPVGTIIAIDGKNLKLAPSKTYFKYSGPFEIINTETDRNYKNYIMRKTQEMSVRTDTLLYRIKNDPNIVCPSIEKDGFYLDNELFYLLVRNIMKRQNTMITGPCGTGKTQSIELICKKLNIPCRIYDMGAMQDPIADLLGVHRLQNGESVFDYSQFSQDIQTPGVIVLDELSRCLPTCLNILFPVLDHRRTLPVEIAGSKDVRQIPIHPDVCFIATCNLGIEYTGTLTLDKALVDRFFPVKFDYLQEKIETQILVVRCKIDTSIAKIISSIMNTIRRMVDESQCNVVCSIRESLMIGDLIYDGFDQTDAIKFILLPLCETKEDRDLISKVIMSK